MVNRCYYNNQVKVLFFNVVISLNWIIQVNHVVKITDVIRDLNNNFNQPFYVLVENKFVSYFIFNAIIVKVSIILNECSTYVDHTVYEILYVIVVVLVANFTIVVGNQPNLISNDQDYVVD